MTHRRDEKLLVSLACIIFTTSILSVVLGFET